MGWKGREKWLVEWIMGKNCQKDMEKREKIVKNVG